jgi:hypothetical protein
LCNLPIKWRPFWADCRTKATALPVDITNSQRVQYEARLGNLCILGTGVRWTYDPACPKGGDHEVA